MTAAPLSLMGIETFCPRCMAVRGQMCVTASGRTRKQTCNERMRAALYAPGTARKYVLDAIAGRWGA